MGSVCSSSQVANAADGNVRYDEPEEPPKPHNVAESAANDVRSSTKSLQRDAAGEPNGDIHQDNTQTTTISNGPATSSKYKIVYFAGVRGRAEISRLILHAAGVPYDELLVTRDEWQQMKPDTPMGQLPLLYVEGDVLAQSKAIARYLASENQLAGKDEMEMTKADMYVDGITDVQEALYPIIMEKDERKKSEKLNEAKGNVIWPFLNRYTSFLDENNSGFLVGIGLTWADLMLYEILTTLQKFDPNLLDQYETLRTHQERISEMPRVRDYLEQRPELPM